MTFEEFITVSGEAVATLASAVAAIIAAAIGFRVNERRRRKEATIQTMLALLSNETVQKGTHLVNRCARAGVAIDEATLTEDELNAVLSMMGFYEFIGISYKAGDLDRDVVLAQRGATFKRLWRCIGAFVERRRVELQTPDWYEHIEMLADEAAKTLGK